MARRLFVPAGTCGRCQRLAGRLWVTPLCRLYCAECIERELEAMAAELDAGPDATAPTSSTK